MNYQKTTFLTIYHLFVGREDDCYISQVGPDEYSVRFVPREEGTHYLHAKLGNKY